MSNLEDYIFGNRQHLKLPEQENFQDKSILILGSSGTIGRKIVELLIKCQPARIILFDHNESSQIKLYSQYKQNKNIEFIPIPGSILDKNLLEITIKKYTPDIIIHSAANKIVPLCEQNPLIAVNVNVLATINLFDIAGKYNIPKFIFISSNEAYKPQNVFGYTKKIAELAMNYYSQKYHVTEYKAVRFGFVLFSQGSVAEIFEQQLSQNKNLTVCDTEQEKYICSQYDAACSVLDSLEIGSSGQVITLDMDKPVKIYDIAKKFINYYNSQSTIEIIGLRPGDKVREPKIGGELGITPTKIKKLFITNINNTTQDKYSNDICSLFNLDYYVDNKSIINKLINICKRM